MRKAQRLEWLLQHPWAIALIVLILLAIAAFVVWENIKETQEKEAQRKRDRAKGGSIWDD